MLHHLLSYNNQSNSKVSSITLKVCFYFVQKARRLCITSYFFWILKKETPSHQIVNTKLISTEVSKYVHIFNIHPSFPWILCQDLLSIFLVFISSNSIGFFYFVSNLIFLTKKYICKYVQSFVNEFVWLNSM